MRSLDVGPLRACYRSRLGAGIIAVAFCACSSTVPGYCDEQRGCPANQVCKLADRVCVTIADAGKDQAAPDSGSVDARGPERALELGEACGGGGKCKSGYCVDGVCCESACEEQCRSCNQATREGTCRLVGPGLDPRRSCAGPAPGTACEGSCNGAGACEYPAAEVTCGSSSCTGALLTNGHCDGAGRCIDEQTTCGGYLCDEAAGVCHATCGGGVACEQGFVCDGGHCKSSGSGGP